MDSDSPRILRSSVPPGLKLAGIQSMTVPPLRK